MGTDGDGRRCGSLMGVPWQAAPHGRAERRRNHAAGKSARNPEGTGNPTDVVDSSLLGRYVQVDRATRETVSGKFLSYDGKELAW